jgi:hypothetical protein
MKTYKEAIKSPKMGYKYSNNIQQTAQLCEMISNKHCLRPEAVFNWATKNEVNLIDYMSIIMSKDTLLKANSALLEDILNEKFDAVKQLKN